MIKLLVAVAMVGACWAEEVETPPPRAIFRSSSAVGDPANWHSSYSYNSPDGTMREESILLKKMGNEVVPDVRGHSSWIDKQTEKRIDLTYQADEQGFRADGDHIPRSEASAAPVEIESGRRTVSAAEAPVTPPSRVPLPPPPPPAAPKKRVGHRFV